MFLITVYSVVEYFRIKLSSSQKRENVLLLICAKLPKIIGLMLLLHLSCGKKKNLPCGGTRMMPNIFIGFYCKLIL